MSKKNKEKNVKISQDIYDFISKHPDMVIDMASKTSKVKQIGCSHTHPDNTFNLKIYKKDVIKDANGNFVKVKQGDCRCKHCHTEFNLAVISEKDMKNAIEIVHNMINQIKVFSGKHDKKKDLAYITELGRQDVQAMKLATVYSKLFLSKGKHKKKNKKKKNAYGGAMRDFAPF